MPTENSTAGDAARPEVILTLPRAAFDRSFGASVRYRPLPADPPAAELLVRRVMACCRPAERTPGLEADETVKQLVAYVILRRRDDRATRFWLYRRCLVVGDDRLKGKLSLGVGGHVCDEDWLIHEPPIGPRTLHEAACRELAEEVGPGAASLGFQGFVNYEGDPVGRCHLGAVFTATFPAGAGPLAVPRQGVEPLGWHTAYDLYRLQDAGADFEAWSVGVLSALRSWSLGPSLGYARVAT